MPGDTESTRQTRQNATDESLKNIQVQLKDILNKIKGLEKAAKKQDEKLEELSKFAEECVKIKADFNELKQQNEKQSKRITDLEDFVEGIVNQKNRNKLEIVGVPTKSPENPVEDIIKIGSAAKIDITGKDIKRAFRLKPKGEKPGVIVVEFEEVTVRDKFCKEVKMIKPTTETIGLKGKTKIFINECLSAKAKNILYKVKQLAYERKWARVWTYGGCVFLKMEQNGRQIKVRTEEDLEVLTN